MSSSYGDWNAGIISGFRKNHGKVGVQFEGALLLLLNHTGARTGKPRTDPVMYLRDGHWYLVFASKEELQPIPDWYHNLKAHPNIKIEVGTVPVMALIPRTGR